MAGGQLSLLKHIIRAGERSSEVSLAELRESYATFLNKFPPVEDLNLEPIDAGGVPAEWIDATERREAAGETERRMLYLHGGGFVLGSITSHRHLVARISRASAARCLAIDYRLAPEDPFPAALDDAVAAYRWLLDHNVDPARLVVAGDSAGAGLGVIAMTVVRDQGAPLPAALVCISPWTDFEGNSDSLERNAELDPIVQREGLIKMAKLYLGDTDPHHPRVSPRAADLRGLPPTLIQVGESETLLDDALGLAEGAGAAGVEVELDLWPEMIHVWHHFAGRLKEGRQAIDKVGEFVRRRVP
ncbi:MAG: alpha/beta hydrolase [bacterium]|nr:alpha/beta hydrolase [bacterium]